MTFVSIISKTCNLKFGMLLVKTLLYSMGPADYTYYTYFLIFQAFEACGQFFMQVRVRPLSLYLASYSSDPKSAQSLCSEPLGQYHLNLAQRMVKGVQVCSFEGPRHFPRGNHSEIANRGKHQGDIIMKQRKIYSRIYRTPMPISIKLGTKHLG